MGSDNDVFVSDHYFTYHRFFIPSVDEGNEIFFWDGHCHPSGVSFTLWVVFNYDIVVLKCRFVFVFYVESAVVNDKMSFVHSLQFILFTSCVSLVKLPLLLMAVHLMLSILAEVLQAARRHRRDTDCLDQRILGSLV